MSLLLSILFVVAVTASNNNSAPIIGILTLPCNQDEQNCQMENVSFNPVTYLPASYVKFIQGGGGRVYPLLSDMNNDKMLHILSQLNGILLTGGDAPFTQTDFYWKQILNILSFLRKYDKENINNAIPVWGTCLGFEALICETAKDGVNFMNKNITANYVALNLNFTKYAKKSRIFNSTMDNEYSNNVYIALKENNITFNEHYYGFTPKSFLNDNYVSGNFTILSTSIDIYNVTFVSLIESNNDLGLYWYGSQFHAEKPMYEFAKNIPKTLNATYSNQYFAQFFVNECRLRNNNKMENKLYDNNNIYNYDPYYTAIQSDNEYQQMYIFPASIDK